MFRIFKPRTFLGCISLRTATEVLAVILAFNKATGVYGILALFTGYELNIFQFLTYLYSIIILCALIFNFLPQIVRNRRHQQTSSDAYLPVPSTATDDRLPSASTASAQSQVQQQQLKQAKQCRYFAALYVLDTVVNAAATIAFSITWYRARAAEQRAQEPIMPNPLSEDDPITALMMDMPIRRDGASSSSALIADMGATSRVTQSSAAGNELRQHAKTEMAMSLVLIIISLLVRVYLCVIVVAYAREVQRDADACLSTLPSTVQEARAAAAALGLNVRPANRHRKRRSHTTNGSSSSSSSSSSGSTKKVEAVPLLDVPESRRA